jgi:ribosome recycling factor
MIEDVQSEAENKMRKAVEALKRELGTIRTGRASPALVERLIVDYYGQPTPLNQLANIAAPEARLLVIQPWDKQSLGMIEKAILKSDLGLTPTNDGRLIRLVIPQLTEERRKELVKVVRKKTEEGRVAIRNIRREAHDDLKDLEKEKLISEDDHKRANEQLQKLTDRYIEEVDHVGQHKEAEVLEV